jgi:hypothetical protein
MRSRIKQIFVLAREESWDGLPFGNTSRPSCRRSTTSGGGGGHPKPQICQRDPNAAGGGDRHREGDASGDPPDTTNHDRAGQGIGSAAHEVAPAASYITEHRSTTTPTAMASTSTRRGAPHTTFTGSPPRNPPWTAPCWSPTSPAPG